MPPHWKREFPVLGAVAATVGSLAAVEAIKLAANIPVRSRVKCLFAIYLQAVPQNHNPTASRLRCLWQKLVRGSTAAHDAHDNS